MKLHTVLTIFVISFSVNMSMGDEKANVETVGHVDLERYMGTWYEIARIPNRFQRKCIGNVSAKYTLNPDGTVQVVNSCLEEGGVTDTAEGVGKVEDKETNARLKVSFFSIFGIHLFWGNYWILYLDDGYQNAVVGEPSREYGWILSRKKELSAEELQPMQEALRENGYDVQDFVPTSQNIGN